jgi:hypothetical protein
MPTALPKLKTEQQHTELRLIYARPKVPEILKMMQTSQTRPTFGMKCDRFARQFNQFQFLQLVPTITNLDPPHDLTAHM